MKKVVLKLDLHDDKDRSKAMRVVSGFKGIESVTMDKKDNQLTVFGDFDPVMVVKKLKKSWDTEIVSVGPAKVDDGKKDDSKKSEDQVANPVKPYTYFHPPDQPHFPPPPYTYFHPPNQPHFPPPPTYYDNEETASCVIC